MFSMTGYGKGVAKAGGIELTAEVKSVNNRFLDVAVKSPRVFLAQEEHIRASVREHISRGHVDVFVSYTDKRERVKTMSVDLNAARGYYAAAEELRTEMEDFLEPVLVYDLPSFSSVSEAGSNSLLSDDLLLSAIWPITRREVVRQQQAQIAGESYTSPYPVDDLGRMMVPVSEVDASYAALFGADAIPQHHTIGDNEENAYAAYLYDPDAACYHVPAYFQSSQYETFLDTIRRKGDTITVRVGYVEAISIGIDDKGDPLPLTADMADHFALFTVEKTEDGYRLVSVEQEE